MSKYSSQWDIECQRFGYRKYCYHFFVVVRLFPDPAVIDGHP